MVHHLAWVNLVAWVLLLGACLALHLDALGQRKVIATMRQTLDANTAELVNVRHALALPAPSAPEGARALGAPPGMVGPSLEESDAARAYEEPVRRTLRTESPSEPPPAGVVPVPSADPEAEARWRRTLRRHPIMDEVTARGIVPVTTGKVLERIARLSPEELARIDALAAERGITREAMMSLALAAGSGALSANDAARADSPTTPPERPANDAPASKRNG